LVASSSLSTVLAQALRARALRARVLQIAAAAMVFFMGLLIEMNGHASG
jgi:hypothetical protein